MFKRQHGCCDGDGGRRQRLPRVDFAVGRRLARTSLADSSEVILFDSNGDYCAGIEITRQIARDDFRAGVEVERD